MMTVFSVMLSIFKSFIEGTLISLDAILNFNCLFRCLESLKWSDDGENGGVKRGVHNGLL